MNAEITWIDDEEEDDEFGDGEEKNKASFPVNAEGNCLHIRIAGPYGFFKVFTDKGPVPKELAGAWTDLKMAKASVQRYISQTVSQVKFNPKGEPAKIKQSKVATANG